MEYKKLNTKQFYILMYALDVKLVFYKTDWFTSKAKAKAYYTDEYTKVLAVTDDTLELLKLEQKYKKKYEGVEI